MMRTEEYTIRASRMYHTPPAGPAAGAGESATRTPGGWGLDDDDQRLGNSPSMPFLIAFCASSFARLVTARLAMSATSIWTFGYWAEPVIVAGTVTRPSCCV